MGSLHKFIRFASDIQHLKKIDAMLSFPFLSSAYPINNYFRCISHNVQFTRSTIYALSTAPGISAIAVVRISGPNSSDVLVEMGKMKKLPEPRRAVLCRIHDPKSNELLDKALALWFPSPNSFTGEDMCELHIHGGIAVVKSVLNVLQKLHQFRLAEPGEFTKRAFMANKLDLTEVEGLADLLHAETEVQQKQALRQMDGVLNTLYSNWSYRIKRCLANTEAYIDFSEDQHLDNTILSSVQRDLDELKEEMSSHLSDGRRGERLRNGVFTVLVGRPNVGKSSLLNSLCQRDIAIVSPIAGTTRDIIETAFNLGGYLVNISDTAGIRETGDSIELEGVKRAKDRSSSADLLLFILEARRALEIMDGNKPVLINLVKNLLMAELGPHFIKDQNNVKNFMTDNKGSQIKDESSRIIVILNKIDLLTEEEMLRVKQLEGICPFICPISCIKGTGMNPFLSLFSSIVKEMCSSRSGEEPILTQERHRVFIQTCFENILEFEETVDLDVAIAAEKLRLAMNALGKITGKVRIQQIQDPLGLHSEDVLERWQGEPQGELRVAGLFTDVHGNVEADEGRFRI